MTALKNCPFCGGNAKRFTESGDERNGYADFVGYRCVGCYVSKGARGDTSKPGYADNSKIEERAIEAWNRRSQPEANADAKDAERYRHLRELMQFSTSPGKPTTMKLRAALPAPDHQPHRDWMGEHFDASVDRTVDADIRACLTGEEIPAFDASRQAKEKGND